MQAWQGLSSFEAPALLVVSVMESEQAVGIENKTDN